MNFKELRDQWALKHTPTDTDIQYQQQIDQQANPHNEPYHNKKPRRSKAEIISDLCYTFADNVLMQQYRATYVGWREEECEEKWGVWYYIS